jgi:hypothetical protein
MPSIGAGAAARMVLAALIATAFAAALAAALAACGVGGSNSATKLYANTQYGFAFRYPAAFTVSTDATFNATAGDSAKVVIGAMDPAGAKVGGRLVNGLSVSVYVLKKEITPQLMPRVKSELEGFVAQIHQQDPASQMSPLESVTVNGVRGYKLTSLFDDQGTAMHAVWYFLIKGKSEYQVSEQATVADWPKYTAELDGAVQTFTVQQRR